MKNTLIILLLSLPASLHAQEDDDNRNWSLKLNAAKLIDVLSFPTVQVSAERKINSWLSVNADLGVQVYNSNRTDTTFLKPKGFKTNIEGRVYLPKLIKGRTTAKREEIYVGLQLFYNQNQANKSISYYPINDSTKRFKDDFGAKIISRGVNFIFGFQASKGRLVLEPYVGLGLIIRNVKNTNIEYNETKHKLDGADLASYFQSRGLEESSGTTTNVTIGFRIGYRF